MPGLWRKNPATPEGKYPVVLRRDGTPLESRYFVLVLKDPAAAEALLTYANEAEQLGMDPRYVEDIRLLAADAAHLAAIAATATDAKKPDPDAPPHRKDDPAVLAWARANGCPGS
jgi:hypothetical protein